MAARAQRVALQRGGGQVILGEKLREGAADAREALRRPGRVQTVRENLEVKEIRIPHGSETRRFVVVRNPEQTKRDRRRREQLLEELEAEVTRLNRGRRGKAHTRGIGGSRPLFRFRDRAIC